jgi:hypothetical protein
MSAQDCPHHTFHWTNPAAIGQVRVLRIAHKGRIHFPMNRLKRPLKQPELQVTLGKVPAGKQSAFSNQPKQKAPLIAAPFKNSLRLLRYLRVSKVLGFSFAFFRSVQTGYSQPPKAKVYPGVVSQSV